MNKITKKEYPDVFADYFEFVKKEIYHEHRRNSNYYTVVLLELTKDNLPEHPELHGLWESDCFIGDHEYGGDGPDELYRTEEKKRTITETYYERVK